MTTDGEDPVEEAEDAVLGHFSQYRFTRDYWRESAESRRDSAAGWLKGLRTAADMVQVYLTGGVQSQGDVLIWSSIAVPSSEAPGRFFTRRASEEARFRRLFEPVGTLWGLTRPSEYSRAKSTQVIDPFSSARAPYLIAYPFTKTEDWYLLGREMRQGMMNEHIRIGKQYREITQLLLYSFGLQDQEFVVVYETEDMAVFSRLVHDLRATEGRRYTKADTPLHMGVWMTDESWLETLG